VAEEINLLMLDGCRVFHDVPIEPYGNIDHVIVAPSAVYAVETKTRRKRKALPKNANQKNYEVFYDETSWNILTVAIRTGWSRRVDRRIAFALI
jgi:homoserine kinase